MADMLERPIGIEENILYIESARKKPTVMVSVGGNYFINPFHYYTYKDYKLFPDDFRCELHNGKVYAMASASKRHNKIMRYIAHQLEEQFIKSGSHCDVFIDNDVRFFPKSDESDSKTKRPDVFVLCGGYENTRVPCFIAEVLSDSTKDDDLGEKKRLYEEARVTEYWVVHSHRKVEVFLLRNDGKYTGQVIEAHPDEQIFEVSLQTVLGLTIKLDRVLFDNVPN